MPSIETFGVPNLVLQIQNMADKLAVVNPLSYKFRISFVDMMHKELLDCYEFEIGYGTYSDDQMLRATINYYMEKYIDELERELGIKEEE